MLSLISIANSQPKINVYPGKDFFLHWPNFAAPCFLLNLRTLFPPVASFLSWVTDGGWEWLWYFVIMGRVNSRWDSNSEWFSFWAGTWVPYFLGDVLEEQPIWLHKHVMKGIQWERTNNNCYQACATFRIHQLPRATPELVGTSAGQSTSLTAARLTVTSQKCFDRCAPCLAGIHS